MLNSLQDRAKRLIGSSTAELWADIVHQKTWFIAIDLFVCCLIVAPAWTFNTNVRFKTLDINHNMNTRGSKSLLCLPKVKTEMFRKSVHYQGATIFNKFERELRAQLSILRYENKLREYYRKT